MQAGELAQGLSLPEDCVFVLPTSMQIFGIFMKDMEAGEPRGVDLQVSEMVDLQAPVKAGGVSWTAHTSCQGAETNVRILK